MTLTILGIIGGLVPLIVLLIRRHLAKKDDPKIKITRGKDEADKIIVDGDADAANRFLEQRLRVLPEESGGDQRGSGSGPP